MDWAQTMFGHCELGDTRRTKRLVDFAGRLASQIGDSIVKCCQGDSAAQLGSYRLLRNAQVRPEAIAEGGFSAVSNHAQQPSLLLAVEDTTALSYTHEVRQELGPIGGESKLPVGGYKAHSVLLLNATDESTVGLIDQTLWCRQQSASGQSQQRKKRAYEDKESYKWQSASERVSQRLGAAMDRTIAICDRESDIYEYLVYKQNQQQRFVVRASLNRRTKTGQYLFETLDDKAPILGCQTIDIGQRGGRSARQARVELRAATRTLLPPRNRPNAGPALSINVVWVQEIDAPEGVKPLCWWLLTSEPIQTLEQVFSIVRYYALRWRIEEYHKAWKSGVGVERQRMQSDDNLRRMIAVTAFVAVRLLRLREDLGPQADEGQSPCDTVLQDDEWQVLWKAREKKALPEKPPTLAWAYQAIARLGGFTDTKRTGRASWHTLWRGWVRLQDLLEGYQLVV